MKWKGPINIHETGAQNKLNCVHIIFLSTTYGIIDKFLHFEPTSNPKLSEFSFELLQANNF